MTCPTVYKVHFPFLLIILLILLKCTRLYLVVLHMPLNCVVRIRFTLKFNIDRDFEKSEKSPQVNKQLVQVRFHSYFSSFYCCWPQLCYSNSSHSSSIDFSTPTRAGKPILYSGPSLKFHGKWTKSFLPISNPAVQFSVYLFFIVLTPTHCCVFTFCFSSNRDMLI